MKTEPRFFRDSQKENGSLPSPSISWEHDTELRYFHEITIHHKIIFPCRGIIWLRCVRRPDVCADSIGIPALVKGFGAVYADSDITDSTSFQYFDAAGNSLGTYPIPPLNNGLSFLGVSFDGPIIRRVRIVYGNSALGPNESNSTDVAVMDDFIYGEPQALSVPVATIRASQVEVCWDSTASLAYQVQYRSSLTPDVWATLVDCVRGAGSTTCVTDAVIVGQPLRIYRILVKDCVP